MACIQKVIQCYWSERWNTQWEHRPYKEMVDMTAGPSVSWTEDPAPQLWALTCFKCFQLQDTLLQREEQLARLQEENNKLREFLSSSFVRNVQQKAKVCESFRSNLVWCITGDTQRVKAASCWKHWFCCTVQIFNHWHLKALVPSQCCP